MRVSVYMTMTDIANALGKNTRDIEGRPEYEALKSDIENRLEEHFEDEAFGNADYTTTMNELICEFAPDEDDQ